MSDPKVRQGTAPHLAGSVPHRSDEATGTSLHYESALPAGLHLLAAILVACALTTLALPLWDADVPSPVPTLAVLLPGLLLLSGLRRRVTLTADGRLLISGCGQHVDVHASRINAITISRRGRLGFASAKVHWEGGKFPIWQAMRYTPEIRSSWSLRHVSGRGGLHFGDLVYRLHAHNPTLVIKGVPPPTWARPPQPPHRW